MQMARACLLLVCWVYDVALEGLLKVQISIDSKATGNRFFSTVRNTNRYGFCDHLKPVVYIICHTPTSKNNADFKVKVTRQKKLWSS